MAIEHFQVDLKFGDRLPLEALGEVFLHLAHFGDLFLGDFDQLAL